MSVDGSSAIDLVLMTVGYWAVDRLIRDDGLVRTLKRLGFRTERECLVVVTTALALVAPFWSWRPLPGGESVRILATAVVAFLSWKAATKDVDVVLGEKHTVARAVLVACAVGAWWSPAFVLAAALLLTTPFSLWEHHATLPMRVLLATVAFAALSIAFVGVPSVMADAAILFWFVVTIQVSHYLITALAKAWLGPRWNSWPRENRLHHIAASAYSWGWMRFLPWATWRRVVHTVRRFERPMQASVFAVEALSPLALLHPDVAVALCVVWSCFHLGVFALSGLLFWDWILTNLAIAAAVILLPPDVTAQAFGPLQTLVAIVFMVAFPLRHKLWRPMPLGWWDTPFTQRVHWHAHGESGRVYGLYANFWCPHERLFGKVNACYLTPVPVMTYHLGEVWKHELRDALRAAGPSPEKLDELRAEFGIEPRSDELAENHVAYIRRLFYELNRGARKQVLPNALRWLKAPGGQCFYWGSLPGYRRQEPVTKVTLRYREEYYDGESLVRLEDLQILEIPIDDSCAQVAPVRPPTPKRIDDLLLEHAQGKLIDLPSFGDGQFVNADDGKSRGETMPAE
ncbi:MAG: hypothetical protein AAGF92_19145 [Myxococcota bacterium]